nr:MAG TPA: hypothetical protein [Caudoviricetes sp.]
MTLTMIYFYSNSQAPETKTYGFDLPVAAPILSGRIHLPTSPYRLGLKMTNQN